MSKSKLWKASILATAVVSVVSGCDPYVQPDESPPVVIGAIVVAASSTTNRNYNFDFYANFGPDAATCPGGLYYPEASYSWFTSTYPTGTGLCGNGVDPITACPETCWPPRSGPAFAPYFLGDVNASYGCADAADTRCSAGVYKYNTSNVYVVPRIPAGIVPATCFGSSAKFNQLRVTFNKVMDGTTIQLPASAGQALCAAADGITVTLRALPAGAPVDVTRPDPARADFPDGMNVCYIPNSSNANWGASLSVQPRAAAGGTNSPALPPNSSFRVTGTVKDQQGNPLDVDVTFITDDGTQPYCPVE